MKKLIVISILAILVSCKTRTPQPDNDLLQVAAINRDTTIFQEIKVIENERTLPINISTDTTEYYREDYLRYSNYIYKSNIKTVQFHRMGWEMSAPIMELGKNEKLKLSFDDLEADLKNYQYTIIHCNSDWQPSELQQGDYIQGFTSDYITSHKSSMNTLQPYTHYSLTFPGEQVIPKVSGNYILIVYVDNPTNPVITQRFMIFEPLVNIEGRVRQATVLEDKNYRQEVVFTIQHNSYRISNPYSSLKVVLQQNDRTDNLITNLKPSMVRNNELIYEFEYGNVFDGNNEFRHFDLKNIRNAYEGIQSIQMRDNAYHVFLSVGERRSFKRYIQEEDINGRYVIKREDAMDSETESEYVHVYFTLSYPVPLIDGHVYLLGAMTSWDFNESSKMIYNYPAKAYEKSLYLKQGYYNYAYAYLENRRSDADIGFIEGTHSITENDYTIYIYNKEPNDRYDRLIGISHLNSRN
ncbi:MAG: DUF5103 domain-containing protein [Bacteroidales bacterium]|nr:DUF5103 domain-containing protein [Bacteroidales bacterium]